MLFLRRSGSVEELRNLFISFLIHFAYILNINRESQTVNHRPYEHTLALPLYCPFIFIIECDLFEWSKSVQVCYCLCISVLPLMIKLSRRELGSYCRGTWPWFPTTNVIFCCVYWTICGFVDTGGIVHHHCLNFLIMINEITLFLVSGGYRGRDLIVGGFTTTCATSAYHHWSCMFESRSWRGVLDATLCNDVR